MCTSILRTVLVEGQETGGKDYVNQSKNENQVYSGRKQSCHFYRQMKEAPRNLSDDDTNLRLE